MLDVHWLGLGLDLWYWFGGCNRARLVKDGHSGHKQLENEGGRNSLLCVTIAVFFCTCMCAGEGLSWQA